MEVVTPAELEETYSEEHYSDLDELNPDGSPQYRKYLNYISSFVKEHTEANIFFEETKVSLHTKDKIFSVMSDLFPSVVEQDEASPYRWLILCRWDNGVEVKELVEDLNKQGTRKIIVPSLGVNLRNAGNICKLKNKRVNDVTQGKGMTAAHSETSLGEPPHYIICHDTEECYEKALKEALFSVLRYRAVRNVPCMYGMLYINREYHALHGYDNNPQVDFICIFKR